MFKSPFEKGGFRGISRSYFREITDAERRDIALQEIEGKRLTYRGTH